MIASKNAYASPEVPNCSLTRVTIDAYSIKARPNSASERKPVASEPFVPEPLLDTDQAAAIMRVHPKTLQRYARQGIVRGFQLGYDVAISRERY